MTSTLTPEILHALRTIRDGGKPPFVAERVLVPSWAVQAMNDLAPGCSWRLTAAGAAVVALADERDKLRLILDAETGLLSRVFATLHIGRRSEVLWGVVAAVFGLGSTRAMELCERLGYDPHQRIGARRRAIMLAAEKAQGGEG